jgi:hypothetical protein
MSPSDLGQTLKPFVFLDIFDASGPTLQAMGEMPLHPHSGIATVTVFLPKGACATTIPRPARERSVTAASNGCVPAVACGTARK